MLCTGRHILTGREGWCTGVQALRSGDVGSALQDGFATRLTTTKQPCLRAIHYKEDNVGLADVLRWIRCPTE